MKIVKFISFYISYIQLTNLSMFLYSIHNNLSFPVILSISSANPGPIAQAFQLFNLINKLKPVIVCGLTFKTIIYYYLNLSFPTVMDKRGHQFLIFCLFF